MLGVRPEDGRVFRGGFSATSWPRGTRSTRGVEASKKITEQQVLEWIAADKAKLPADQREFIQYASFHVLHNAGVSAQNLNHARVGLSKALNSTARWAPRVVNPVDVNGKGIVYRFDIRDYWGHTLIDTSAPDFTLFYGGSDDDLAFATSKLDLNGKPIKYASLAEMVHTLKPEVTRDEKFARLAWARILKGNAEGAVEGESLPPDIEGFFGTRKIGPNGQEYVDPASLRYVEAGQLTYTLTRPDAYNAIIRCTLCAGWPMRLTVLLVLAGLLGYGVYAGWLRRGESPAPQRDWQQDVIAQ